MNYPSRNYDPRSVAPESRKAVEKLLRDRADSFDPVVAKRASTAAVPLTAWVKANVKFSYVLEKVKPLEQEQNKLQRYEYRISKISFFLSSVLQRSEPWISFLVSDEF